MGHLGTGKAVRTTHQVRRVEIEFYYRAALHIVEDARFLWTDYEITELAGRRD